MWVVEEGVDVSRFDTAELAHGVDQKLVVTGSGQLAQQHRTRMPPPAPPRKAVGGGGHNGSLRRGACLQVGMPARFLSAVLEMLRRMSPLTLTEIERVIRSSWGADTSPPEMNPRWDPEHPAKGQCGVTALVVNHLFGGDLVRGEVLAAGQWTDYHWWNRLASGVEIDLTGDQFRGAETVVDGTTVPRPRSISQLRHQYEVLRARVPATLDLEPRSTNEAANPGFSTAHFT